MKNIQLKIVVFAFSDNSTFYALGTKPMPAELFKTQNEVIM